LPGIFFDKGYGIPAPDSYLAAEPERKAFWAAKLPQGGFKIGIVWQGNPRYPSDRKRSVPLEAFASLAKIPNIRLISLQKHHGLEQLERLHGKFKIELLPEDFDSGPEAFIDTAAVIQNLDLVISIDSAVIHLAGALGCTAWLPLTEVPHWLWMLEREDSPWYPRTRLFRQSVSGSWREPFLKIANELKQIIQDRALSQGS
jgi:hypothetical protein